MLDEEFVLEEDDPPSILLLEAAELEDFAEELLDVAELDEATFDDEEIPEAATTFTLPVTVIVLP